MLLSNTQKKKVDSFFLSIFSNNSFIHLEGAISFLWYSINTFNVPGMWSMYEAKICLPLCSHSIIRHNPSLHYKTFILFYNSCIIYLLFGHTHKKKVGTSFEYSKSEKVKIIKTFAENRKAWVSFSIRSILSWNNSSNPIYCLSYIKWY